MKIIEKELFNELVPEAGKVLVNKAEYSAYLQATVKGEEATINRSSIVYLPKKLTFEWAQSEFAEIGESEEVHE